VLIISSHAQPAQQFHLTKTQPLTMAPFVKPGPSIFKPMDTKAHFFMG